ILRWWHGLSRLVSRARRCGAVDHHRQIRLSVVSLSATVLRAPVAHRVLEDRAGKNARRDRASGGPRNTPLHGGQRGYRGPLRRRYSGAHWSRFELRVHGRLAPLALRDAREDAIEAAARARRDLRRANADGR